MKDWMYGFLKRSKPSAKDEKRLNTLNTTSKSHFGITGLRRCKMSASYLLLGDDSRIPLLEFTIVIDF